jgi:hypothetical protein
MSPGRDIKAIAAMTYARVGDTDKARKMAAQLSAQEPVATITQDFVLPSVLAAAEIASSNPSRALELLVPAAPYQDADAATSTANLGNLYPVYLRGVARLQSNAPDFGMADFSYILQRPGMTTNFVVGPLARLYLARAQVKAGDRQAAAKTYQDLLAIWKEADADVPVVRAAKSEYSALQ